MLVSASSNWRASVETPVPMVMDYCWKVVRYRRGSYDPFLHLADKPTIYICGRRLMIDSTVDVLVVFFKYIWPIVLIPLRLLC